MRKLHWSLILSLTVSPSGLMNSNGPETLFCFSLFFFVVDFVAAVWLQKFVLRSPRNFFFCRWLIMLLQTMRNITRLFYSRQLYMTYEDSRLTASSSAVLWDPRLTVLFVPCQRSHVWFFSINLHNSLLLGFETQASWYRNINEPLVKQLD